MTEIEPKKRSVFGRLFGKDEAGPAAVVLDDERTPAVPGKQPAEVQSAEAEAAPSWFQRLRQGLSKTSTQLTEGITGVFTKRKLDATTLEEFEELLIRADLGMDTASRIVERLSSGPLRQGNLAGSRQRDPRR